LGWEKVAYGLKKSWPLIDAFAIPGVWELKALSPKK